MFISNITPILILVNYLGVSYISSTEHLPYYHKDTIPYNVHMNLHMVLNINFIMSAVFFIGKYSCIYKPLFGVCPPMSVILHLPLMHVCLIWVYLYTLLYPLVEITQVNNNLPW